ncbi:putative F420-0 ABC transporter substrate-binding protein [Pseudolysinimonas yzui]|uniref:ABC transporter substrate-binding protein n=1 Tax=Pseudolysinimonas yzui TaxID=2708254 RepID=A0A8J3LY91_9MICO|nr:putative F420-0 ABC transporter substrate-binding protein [Pseudolysinimonas yzui]GHF05840.1 ABC transporter substrate-binding protein [Pseudolysinimonas yzui]
MTRSARPVLAVAVVPLVALLAACAAPAPSPSATASAVTVENCGVSVTFDTPPQRVVTIKSTSTEMMLALGVGDRIVGTAFQDGPVPDEWAADAVDLASISDFMPSEEAVLDLEPDLVYSGWESAFAADAAGERSELSALGVASYVQPAACRSADVPPKLTFDEVFREIQEAADIFGVSADDLLAAQQSELDAIEADDRGLTALWYSSGTDIPYVGAGLGAPQLVLETAGLTNIAGDIEMTWSSFGWESIVAADPDVIVLIDADWNTAASKIELLESNPATAALAAVQKRRYIVLPFAAGEAGVRTVSAAASVAEQLAELDLP